MATTVENLDRHQSLGWARSVTWSWSRRAAALHASSNWDSRVAVRSHSSRRILIVTNPYIHIEERAIGGGAKIPQHTSHIQAPEHIRRREYHSSSLWACECVFGEGIKSQTERPGIEPRERRVDDENRKKSIKTIRFSSKIHFHSKQASKQASTEESKERRYSTFSSTEKPTARHGTNAARLRHHKQQGCVFRPFKGSVWLSSSGEDTASISRRNDDDNQEIQRALYTEKEHSRRFRAREITPNWEKNMDFRITLLLIIGKYFIEAFIPI